MAGSECPDCKRRLGAKTTCRCGWVMPGTAAGAPSRPMIACCYAECIAGALCRVWTKTGWANVCLTHYPKIDRADRPTGKSWFEIECRTAYEKSHDYRKRHGGQKVDSGAAEIRKQVEAEFAQRRKANFEADGRDPGADDDDLPLGIGRDPLEQEILDRAAP